MSLRVQWVKLLYIIIIYAFNFRIKVRKLLLSEYKPVYYTRTSSHCYSMYFHWWRVGLKEAQVHKNTGYSASSPTFPKSNLFSGFLKKSEVKSIQATQSSQTLECQGYRSSLLARCPSFSHTLDGFFPDSDCSLDFCCSGPSSSSSSLIPGTNALPNIFISSILGECCF